MGIGLLGERLEWPCGHDLVPLQCGLEVADRVGQAASRRREHAEPMVHGSEEAHQPQRAIAPGIRKGHVVEDPGPRLVLEQVNCVGEAHEHGPPQVVVVGCRRAVRRNPAKQIDRPVPLSCLGHAPCRDGLPRQVGGLRRRQRLEDRQVLDGSSLQPPQWKGLRHANERGLRMADPLEPAVQFLGLLLGVLKPPLEIRQRDVPHCSQPDELRMPYLLRQLIHGQRRLHGSGMLTALELRGQPDPQTLKRQLRPVKLSADVEDLAGYLESSADVRWSVERPAPVQQDGG
jgi:hypothetical protein